MAPIRVGLIGLSAKTGTFEPGVWAINAHLPPLLSSPDYEIVALSNSSVQAARNSIAMHKLPDTVKAYDNPEDLAADPNVDLVVVSVAVGKHGYLTKPAIAHKKDVFVEWPLGMTLEESEELTRLAKEAGVKTIVGVQARADPLLIKLKEILAEGKIGRIMSTSVLGCSSLLPPDAWMAGGEWYMDLKSGGNEFYIFFGHFLDSFISVLGDFAFVQSTLQTQWKTVPIMNFKTGEVVHPGMTKTTPDHILVQGQLADSGAVASISFRHPRSAVDDTGFKWIISGTEGEIEIHFPDKSQWQVANADTKLRIKVEKEGKVEEIDFRAEIQPGSLAAGWDLTALNTGLLYEAFAKGDESRYATFESAVRSHRALEEILRVAKWA